MRSSWEGNRKVWRRTGHASQTFLLLHLRALGLGDGDNPSFYRHSGVWWNVPLPIRFGSTKHHGKGDYNQSRAPGINVGLTILPPNIMLGLLCYCWDMPSKECYFHYYSDNKKYELLLNTYTDQHTVTSVTCRIIQEIICKHVCHRYFQMLGDWFNYASESTRN